jgi:putative transposase
MREIYAFCGISKQAFQQHLVRHLRRQDLYAQLVMLMEEIRRDHPRMSAREMYHRLRPEGIGRDRFEAFAFQHGFRLKRLKNYRKTTWSNGVRFPNLIAGRELNGIDQVWVSDITYYDFEAEFRYMTIIMDLYSRRILGHNVSASLRTDETTLPALKMALKLRGIRDYGYHLTFQSDGGGQYYCDAFLALTKTYRMHNSMGETVYENPHAERVIGTLKNDYVIPYGPQNDRALAKAFDKAVLMYNTDRSHSALGKMTPVHYEAHTASLPESMRPRQIVYKEDLSTVIHRYQQKEKRTKKEKTLLQR